MSFQGTQQRRLPSGRRFLYGEDGDLLEAGDWTLAADGKWERCAA
jgi:hypothetical protein